jgi:hypothetical protein
MSRLNKYGLLWIGIGFLLLMKSKADPAFFLLT